MMISQRILSLICLAGWLLNLWMSPPAIALESADSYETRAHHSSDGIGKFYMGREIAHVMGYEGAAWLERVRREGEEKPQVAIAAFDLHPTDVVADIGAGTGYFSVRMAARVPQGKVLAVDVQPEMLEILNYLKTERHLTNLDPILGDEQSPHLPGNSVDVALMVDVYHEFAYPREMMSAIVAALKPGGRVVLLEYRAENPLIAIKALHKMTQTQVKAEMAAVGLNFRDSKNLLPQQHLLIFEKPLSS
jgi:precorrin-6B methylase 2